LGRWKPYQISSLGGRDANTARPLEAARLVMLNAVAELRNRS
jgi:hypothetical protein